MRHAATFRGRLAGVVFGLFCGALAMSLSAAEPAGQYRVYFGTYSGEMSKGIYVSELDVATGKLTAPRLAAETTNPSFLAIHPNGKTLYSVSEIGELGGKKTGGVAGFRIDAATGELKLINQQASEGTGPCHLVVDHSGKALLVANYGGGSVASLPIGDDGALSPAASAIQHAGKSANPQRQEAPHAHSINVDAQNKFAFAADLGLDKVLVYRLDAAAAKLTPHDPPSASVAGGAGPRHFAFHPSGKYAYVINEMGNTVTAFSYAAEQGVLKEIQTIGTLPAEHKEPSYTAEVVVHPSGKFVYGSNRGHDSLAVYSVDAGTGKLTLVEITKTGGKTPRNFNIDPTGAWLLCGNQGSNTVTTFKIDSQTGKLTAHGEPLAVGAPVCIKFLKR